METSKTKTDTILVGGQLIVTSMMAGIIWLVQCVTYPQFLDVGAAEFVGFHERYTAAITPVVAPLMIVELALAVCAAWYFRRTQLRWLLFAGAAIAGLLWLTTILIQVPLHETLAAGRSIPVIRELVATNWIRTALWSLRVLLLFFVARRLQLL